MEASSTLWEKWQEQVKELLSDVHGHQKKSLALSVYLQGISAAKMPTSSLFEDSRTR